MSALHDEMRDRVVIFIFLSSNKNKKVGKVKTITTRKFFSPPRLFDYSSWKAWVSLFFL